MRRGPSGDFWDMPFRVLLPDSISRNIDRVSRTIYSQGSRLMRFNRKIAVVAVALSVVCFGQEANSERLFKLHRKRL